MDKKKALEMIADIQYKCSQLATFLQTNDNTMSLIFIDKIPASERAAFSAKLVEVAKYLQVNPNWLMAIFYAESRVNPAAVNRTTGATGLIQFMPKTANSLGISTEVLKNMQATQQLEWVQKYYDWLKGKMKNYYDVYLATFFPAAIGKKDTYIFTTSNISASTIARQNPAVNINKDSKITLAEFKLYVKQSVPLSVQNAVFGTTIDFIPFAFLGALLLIN